MSRRIRCSPSPPGPALLDRQAHVDVGRLRDVERLDIIVRQRHFDTAAGCPSAPMRTSRVGPLAVFDHVGEQLLDGQVDRRRAAARRCPGARTRPTVNSKIAGSASKVRAKARDGRPAAHRRAARAPPSCRLPAARHHANDVDRVLQRRKQLAHRRRRDARRTSSRTRASPNASPPRVAMLVEAVGQQHEDVAGLEGDRNGGLRLRQRHRAQRKTRRPDATSTCRSPRGTCRIGPCPPLWKRSRCVAGSSRPMKAVMKRSAGSVSARRLLTCDVRDVEIGAEPERHAQHRVHLGHRQRRRDAVAGGIAEHDQEPALEQCEVERVAARELGRPRRAADLVAGEAPASSPAACSSGRRAPSRAPAASARRRSPPRSSARAAARRRTARRAPSRAPHRRRRTRRPSCSAPA